MKILALATIALLTGCATNPAAIRPTPTDHMPFMVYDCATLAEKVAATNYQLHRYVRSQSKARATDVLTWPVSTARIFGKNRRNVEAIQRLGGELEALKKAHALKCDEA
jgi:hypothetical protein